MSSHGVPSISYSKFGTHSPPSQNASARRRRDSGRYSVTHAPCVPRTRARLSTSVWKKRSPVWVAVPSMIERSAALSSRPWSGGRVSFMPAGPALGPIRASLRPAGCAEATPRSPALRKGPDLRRSTHPPQHLAHIPLVQEAHQRIPRRVLLPLVLRRLGYLL